MKAQNYKSKKNLHFFQCDGEVVDITDYTFKMAKHLIDVAVNLCATERDVDNLSKHIRKVARLRMAISKRRVL